MATACWSSSRSYVRNIWGEGGRRTPSHATCVVWSCRRTPPHATCVVLLSSHSSACHLCCLVVVALLRMPPVLSCLVVALLRMPPVLPCLVVNLRCESRGGRGEKEREGKRAERGRKENLEGCMPDLTSLTLTSMLCREGSSPSQEVPTYGLLT